MKNKSLLIKNIHQLLQVETSTLPTVAVKGTAMKQLPIIEDAFLYCENERIISFGKMNELETVSKIFANDAVIVDATGRIVAPMYADSHTHLVFAATREHEFVDRIKGLSYEEIAARGGGIINSAKRLNDTSEDELLASAWQRLQEVIALGTGAIEIKSGYGLSVAGELKMLRVIQRLKKISSIPIKANFLAGHAYPIIYKDNHQGFIDLIIKEMLPQVAAENLADYIDVFCEKGFFSVDETAQILEAAAKYNLKPKIHANQLHYSGGVQVGVKYSAISVDHLECVGEEEINCLLGSKTMPTLLPSAAFFLGINYQPARKIIDAGLPIALASDYNPGSSPSGNMNFVMSLACTQMKLLPEEAINAATVNGAVAMELEQEVGSIKVGKLANLIITKPISSYSVIPYSFGKSVIERVIVKGEI